MRNGRGNAEAGATSPDPRRFSGPNALQGIQTLVAEVVADMQAHGEDLPTPLADHSYSGEFRVRISPE